eukprot:GHVP01042708.1.p1 GENE.GHVP01042708.1~~GHVP01042708.1.p1  ORF type:complete len:102 (-),score=7.20 GHVP01042708.1:297-602(-)
MASTYWSTAAAEVGSYGGKCKVCDHFAGVHSVAPADLQETRANTHSSFFDHSSRRKIICKNSRAVICFSHYSYVSFRPQCLAVLRYEPFLQLGETVKIILV